MTKQYELGSPKLLEGFKRSGMALGGLLALASLWLMSEPFTQNPLYHQFADQRPILGIPHALNVLSNVAFCFVGLWGCSLVSRRVSKKLDIGVIYISFFVGVFLTGIGSAYYHWSPSDASLVWDRLPMTVGFMSFTAIVLAERYDERLGLRCFPWLLMAGITSVGYWIWNGDLRPYLLVQFVPMLVLPIIIWRFSGPGTIWLWATVVLYILAKMLEVFDHSILLATESLVSGHSLKHLVAAAGALMIVIKARVSLNNKTNRSMTKDLKRVRTTLLSLTATFREK